jgi:hypothetical protein
MKKFLMFDLMISPWIIRILYWLAQLGVIIAGILTIFDVTDLDFVDSTFLAGLIIIVGGSLVLRLLFEGIIILFKICENTSQLKELLKTQK